MEATNKQQLIDLLNNDNMVIDNNKINLMISMVNSVVKRDNYINSNVDMTSPKYKMLLKYCNMILKNIGKSPIMDLREFKDIEREDIIKKQNIHALHQIENDIFKVFNRSKSGYYRNLNSEAFALNVLRGLCKQIDGVQLKFYQKDKSQYINGKSVRWKRSFYSIYH